ncbi:MAG: molybdopterin molybdotransferase MoeA [Alphaproteobacteria bacterium]|nr:molybdopterin molybdotransferase MoeA [Alphaproteobacteria bacterium]
MISVEAARQRILADLAPVAHEVVPLSASRGRVLFEDVTARRSQPPAAVSAMDGYACRAADVTQAPAQLRVVGRAPAGASYAGVVGSGETVRIFTGAPLPAGTDTIVIQENVTAARNGAVGETVTINEATAAGRFVRPEGLDFKSGAVGLRRGRRLTVRDMGLAAAMNRPWLTVHRRPRVAILSTGDEVVAPGDPIGPNQIVSSNAVALTAFVEAMGGTPVDLGIAPDDADALGRMADASRGVDLLVTTGGASVGDHDLVRDVLGQRGLALDFWKIAMRPGKPLMFGRVQDVPLIGLPGNPVSTLVCAVLFIGPALDRLAGGPGDPPAIESAVLGIDLPANDGREDYLRAVLERDSAGRQVVRPFGKQDSSMVGLLASADALVRRMPHAPAIAAGGTVEMIRLASVPGL